MDYELSDIFGSFEMGGETHHYVDEELALAHLLLGEVVFSNGRRYTHAPGHEPMTDDGETTILFVNCNDIFAWACADAEDLPHSEIGPLFKMWHADKVWGAAKWCALRRNQKPQPPVIKSMKANGSWDDLMERLGTNTQDAEVQAAFAAIQGVRP